MGLHRAGLAWYVEGLRDGFLVAGYAALTMRTNAKALTALGTYTPGLAPSPTLAPSPSLATNVARNTGLVVAATARTKASGNINP